jgi:hypothetical protein
MNYLIENTYPDSFIGANESLCNAWVMTRINYINLAKSVRKAHFTNNDIKVVLFEYGYDPKNNHMRTDFVQGTDTLVNTHVNSAAFADFCSKFLTTYNSKIHVYVRRKVDHDTREFHPFLKQVVMNIEPGAFDDPEMPSLIPLDQTLE